VDRGGASGETIELEKRDEPAGMGQNAGRAERRGVPRRWLCTKGWLIKREKGGTAAIERNFAVGRFGDWSVGENRVPAEYTPGGTQDAWREGKLVQKCKRNGSDISGQGRSTYFSLPSKDWVADGKWKKKGFIHKHLPGLSEGESGLQSLFGGRERK